MSDTLTPDQQMKAYGEAVRSGLYAKKSGLVGKYDNVRRYWEDETTRHFLRPHLERLIEDCRKSFRRIRIMDLGCGSADGYELLAGVQQKEADLCSQEVDVLTPDILGVYKGVDLSTDLLQQAADVHGRLPKLVFEQADFTQGLPLADGEDPYDLYFTSYGTCSHHNDDETLIELLVEVAQRTRERCLIVCDWLGRYSYEWQTLWTNDLSANRNMDYVVSYIYDEEERVLLRDELDHLTLRLMSRPEAEDIVSRASRKADVEIRQLRFFDRSVFTGRHMDTGEYNPYAQPMRAAVNALHEANTRANLNDLILDYVPKQGFDLLNRYYEHIQMCWNVLVQYVERLLADYDHQRHCIAEEQREPAASYPEPLRAGMIRMRRVVEGVGWMHTGLPRENVIEPQLGYALRNMVMGLQEGRGCGHGLVGVFEVTK